jgi:hypothetical protein
MRSGLTITVLIVIRQGPDMISVQIDHVVAQLSAWDEFVCDLATAAITALAAEVAPELIEAEVLGDDELRVLCQDFFEDITGS